MKTKLCDIDLLEELQKPEHRELRGRFTPLSFAPSELMFTPQSEKNLVFVVTSGRVRIFLAGTDRELTLSILEPGDIYATHTPAYLSAMGEVSILVMDAAEFRNHLATHPALSRIVIYVLGAILNSSFSIIDSLAFKDIRKRLCEFILYEASRDGIDPAGACVELGMTTEQLAAIVGSTRQTVSTLINEMVREGVLEKKGRSTFKILDCDRLAEEG